MKKIALCLATALTFASAATTAIHAQAYPAAPVKLIIGSGPGSAPDVIARILAEALSRRWGQQVYVANHPGAAGAVAMKVAGTSAPDGYTLLFGLSSTFVALPEIAKDFPYDLARDFVGIGFVCEQPMAIGASPSLGVKTLADFIDYAKKRPGQVNVAVLSRGSIPHLTAEWIKFAAGTDWTAINYAATPAGLSDVAGGRVQAIIDGLPGLAGAINGSQIKLLALGSPQRLRNRPDVPTVAETLPAIPHALGFFALMGPPGLPEAIAKKISDDLSAVLSEDATKKSFEEIASYVNPMTPAQLSVFIRNEQTLWKPVIDQVSSLHSTPK